MLTISTVYAQFGLGGPGGANNMLVNFTPFILIIVIMYFLILRPQQKRMKQHQDMVTFSARPNSLSDRLTCSGRTTTSIAPRAGGNLVGGRSVGKSRTGSGTESCPAPCAPSA